jgi:hypothetical protein
MLKAVFERNSLPKSSIFFVVNSLRASACQLCVRVSPHVVRIPGKFKLSSCATLRLSSARVFQDRQNAVSSAVPDDLDEQVVAENANSPV